MEKITLSNGFRCDPFNLDARKVSIDVIAHHLSQQCRFAGATKEFYSVAQHSLAVADMASQSLNSITNRMPNENH